MKNVFALVSLHIDIQIHIHPCVESPVLYKMYSSLQQNKNTMFDDKEQVFCEEKKKGLLFTLLAALPRMVTLCGNCVIIVFDLLLLKKVNSL